MIIVRNVDMPSNCQDCRFCYDDMACIITGDRVDFEYYDVNRAETCPLENYEEMKPIDYAQCAGAMLMLWIDNIVTDGEYNRIMDKLNKAHENGTI